MTAEPVHVGEKHWFLLIASPLADVDSVVRELFHRAVWWAAFLALSIAGVLGSTAVQLIRRASDWRASAMRCSIAS